MIQLKSIKNAVICAIATLSFAQYVNAGLVPIDYSVKPTATILERYEWEQKPGARVQFCLDEYRFYDKNEDGVMDDVSVYLSPDGRGKYLMNPDLYKNSHINMIDWTDMNEESIFLDEKFAQNLFQRLVKASKEELLEERVISSIDSNSGVHIFGEDGKEIDYPITVTRYSTGHRNLAIWLNQKE
ncbi:hypothetical protein C4573_04645 [Candidatus Woesearchaeota archaeon]|nr:MAG: hypothetical protein C4573_04645 [Candidatus Woesearchaeota archaeon]